MVQVFHSFSIRWKCKVCGETFTITPEFALPYKNYIKDAIFQTTDSYANDNRSSYEKTAVEICTAYCGVNKNGDPDPEAPPLRDPNTGNEPSLAASTIHRWVTFVGEQKEVARKAMELLIENDPTSTIHRLTFAIAARKYRTHARKLVLQHCLKIAKIKRDFEDVFKSSLFPIFAITCRYG